MKAQSNKHRASIADVFCDTYVEMDENPRRGAYISLSPIVVNKRFCNNPELLFVSNAKAHTFDRDGFPVHKVRTRYANALRKCGDNVYRLKNLLNEVFTDEAIKLLFTMPNVWILSHNYLAAKQRRAEECEQNRIRKIDKEGYALHKQVEAVVKNRSADALTRFARKLQLEK